MKSAAKPLSREFYLRDVNLVAPELLGKLLVHRSKEGVTAGMIVEVEAYSGSCDKGSHAYQNKRTPRTEIQFGPGGFAYVYAIYGMHWCFNVVTGTENQPDVVFIRALEPVDGIELMQRRREPKIGWNCAAARASFARPWASQKKNTALTSAAQSCFSRPVRRSTKAASWSRRASISTTLRNVKTICGGTTSRTIRMFQRSQKGFGRRSRG